MNPKNKKVRRNERVVTYFKKGVKKAEIARIFKITRQRIDQLLANALDK